jgi:redox-sensitive bicupin YhaK (pirin superfamily)
MGFRSLRVINEDRVTFEQIMNTAIDLIVESKTRELINDFKVRRVLPSAKRRMVGPFIFLDQMGPEILTAGKGLDVAPHPHIGLATVTYLFQGEMLHRDSLGTIQMIRPGEVNWMTAGSGIAHSERTPPEIRNSNSSSELFGIQIWVALPTNIEEITPEFAHYAADHLPVIEGEGKIVRVIAGSLYGETSPVKTSSELFYADVLLAPGAKLPVSAEHEERAIYIVEGSIEFTSGNGVYNAGQLLVLKPNEKLTLTAASKTAHVLLLGGEPMNEKRFIWWNFVSSSQTRIEQAKEDWKAGRFAPVPEETEYISLPRDSRPVVARYP